MSKKVHNKFLQIASVESSDLYEAISRVGCFDFKPKRNFSLAVHLCRSVVGQQLSTKAADSIWKRFLSLSDHEDLLDFIDSSRIEKLKESGLSSAKSRTLKEIAQAFISNDIDEDNFSKLDHIERSKQITKIWGIGQWTADMLNIFYFGEEDIWPKGDLAATNTFNGLTGNLEVSCKFKPFRSYLAMYMWKYRDNEWATTQQTG